MFLAIKSLQANITIGILRQLHHEGLITDMQLELCENEIKQQYLDLKTTLMEGTENETGSSLL